MPRRVYLLGVGLALVALALGFTDWALSLRPGVTERNVRRIRPGMTLKQVEGVFGGPTDWKMGVEAVGAATKAEVYRPGERWGLVWNGRRGAACVLLDEAGRVTRAWWEPDEDADSPFSRLRAWLGW